MGKQKLLMAALFMALLACAEGIVTDKRQGGGSDKEEAAAALVNGDGTNVAQPPRRRDGSIDSDALRNNNSLLCSNVQPNNRCNTSTDTVFTMPGARDASCRYFCDPMNQCFAGAALVNGNAASFNAGMTKLISLLQVFANVSSSAVDIVNRYDAILNWMAPGLAQQLLAGSLRGERLAQVIQNSPNMVMLRRAACGLSAIELLVRIVETMVGCRTNDFLSGSMAMTEEGARLSCGFFGLVSSCGLAGPLTPVVAIGAIACSSVRIVADMYVCANMKNFCLQNIGGATPVSSMTPETNYSGDLHCCCNARRDFTGAWTISPEHQCINEGRFFRPGTCGASIASGQRASTLPQTPDQCRAYNAAPPSVQPTAPIVSRPIAPSPTVYAPQLPVPPVTDCAKSGAASKTGLPEKCVQGR